MYAEITDVNECELEKPSCEHECTNTNGGYGCGCDVGFEVLDDDGGCQGKNATANLWHMS